MAPPERGPHGRGAYGGPPKTCPPKRRITHQWSIPFSLLALVKKRGFRSLQGAPLHAPNFIRFPFHLPVPRPSGVGQPWARPWDRGLICAGKRGGNRGFPRAKGQTIGGDGHQKSPSIQSEKRGLGGEPHTPGWGPAAGNTGGPGSRRCLHERGLWGLPGQKTPNTPNRKKHHPSLLTLVKHTRVSNRTTRSTPTVSFLHIPNPLHPPSPILSSLGCHLWETFLTPLLFP